jgi:hypothetical protein
VRGRLKRYRALEGGEDPVADGKSVVPVHGGFVDGPGWLATQAIGRKCSMAKRFLKFRPKRSSLR